MFGISLEHLLIVGAVLLIFGPKRLPELGKSLGRGIRNFKEAISGVEEATFKHVENKDAKTPGEQTHTAAHPTDSDSDTKPKS